MRPSHRLPLLMMATLLLAPCAFIQQGRGLWLDQRHRLPRGHGIAFAQGDAAQEIVRAAEHEKVDQIAMGTRGMSALGNLLLGSVAQKVLHLGHTPVLLVK